ncbi:MAG: hypothetical protein WC934_13165, partial [Acidithiobacillus sp.]|uniref:hypothetical protein n=1 Tax=Acidithiobacillus sp. TaxID=1872118 RepID=UPI00355E5B78
MNIGTKSVLFGAHCFIIHWFFVAIGWIKLFGFPRDIRIWVAFFIHDIGYFGKSDLDGHDGILHVELGGKIMGILFGDEWKEFSTNHSRHYCKKYNKIPSKLCYADKLVPVIEPSWLYLFRVRLSGEIYEYKKFMDCEMENDINWLTNMRKN